MVTRRDDDDSDDAPEAKKMWRICSKAQEPAIALTDFTHNKAPDDDDAEEDAAELDHDTK